MQKDILKAETNRQEVSDLSFTISQEGANYSATISSSKLKNVTYETQLTFLLMAHELEMPKDFFSIMVKITEIELLSLHHLVMLQQILSTT